MKTLNFHDLNRTTIYLPKIICYYHNKIDNNLEMGHVIYTIINQLMFDPLHSNNNL